MAKIRAKGTPKSLKIKSLSLPEFFEKYGTEEKCIAHFEKCKWPNGFVCPSCKHTHYYYCEKKQIYECEKCGHQTTIKANTIMANSKLPLCTWLLMMYLIACSVNGISAVELSRQAQIGYSAAKLNARKIKYAMFQRNGRYMLEGIVELDEFYLGAPSKDGKRGLATNKQETLLTVSVDQDDKPKFIRFNLLKNSTTQGLAAALLPTVKKKSTLSGDGKRSYIGLKEHYDVIMEVNNYRTNPNQHFWVNTIISNVKSFLQGTYHGVDKRYLSLALAEFEWRFNRRYFGREKLPSIVRSVLHCPYMSHKKLVEYFREINSKLGLRELPVPEL